MVTCFLILVVPYFSNPFGASLLPSLETGSSLNSFYFKRSPPLSLPFYSSSCVTVTYFNTEGLISPALLVFYFAKVASFFKLKSSGFAFFLD